LRRRAIQPSKKSVIAAMRKMPRPTNSRPANLVRSTTTRKGTRKMRSRVRALGRFQISVERLGITSGAAEEDGDGISGSRFRGAGYSFRPEVGSVATEYHSRN
jgi:hypothetical protein